MPKDAAVTVRLPLPLKKRLERRAKAQRRSVSAQIVHDLETLMSATSGQGIESTVPLLGRFEGGLLPTDADFDDVRGLLWGGLGARRS